MKRLISSIAGATAGLWLAVLFIPKASVILLSTSHIFNFKLTAYWQVYLMLGAALGLLNFFVKPVLDTISLPLRIITLGLFGFIINMGLLWLIDFYFVELQTPWFWPLFWTTLIIWLTNIAVYKLIFNSNDKS